MSRSEPKAKKQLEHDNSKGSSDQQGLECNAYVAVGVAKEPASAAAAAAARRDQSLTNSGRDSTKVAMGIVGERAAYHRDESIARRQQLEEDEMKSAQKRMMEGEHTTRSHEEEEKVEDGHDDDNLSEEELIRRITTTYSSDVPGAFAVVGIGGSENSASTRGSITFGGGSTDDEPRVPEEGEAGESSMLQAPINASLVVSSQTETGTEQDLEAQVCLEEALEVISVGERRPSKAPQEPTRRRQVWISLIFCLLVAVTVLVSVVVLSTESNAPPPKYGNTTSTTDPTESANQTQAPSVSEVPLALEDYPPFTIRAIKRNPDGPQARANAWMYNDPNFQSYPHWRRIQRFALAVKFFALDGPNWTRSDHWLSYDVHECEWYSSSEDPTSVCNEQGHLLIEDLRHNNLGGESLPPEALMCPFTIYFDHSHNNVRGQFPPFLSSGIIEVFRWSNNSLDGPLVVEQGFEATALRIIEVDGNNLMGSFYFPAFPALEILNISNNRFGGTISNHGLETLSDLRIMDLTNNEFEGTMPSELGHLSSLETLHLAGNEHLSGTIPAELEELSNLDLLDISGAQITGQVPLRLCEGNRTGTQTILADCGNNTMQCCGQQ